MDRNRNERTVYLDDKSAPRLLFSGTRVVEVSLPRGTRVLYPNPPLAPLPDLDAAIDYALNHPHGSPPLAAKLVPGMKVVIALDDVSLPLPPMRKPDVRERVLTRVLELCDAHDVRDVQLVVAIAYHRKMTAGEMRDMVGKRIYERFAPDRYWNFDAEDKDNLVVIGKTRRGVPVDFCKPAAEADLIIYVNINLVPLNGGFKSLGVGLCGGSALNSHHEFQTLRDTASFMDPASSALHAGIEDVGRVINEHCDVFHIETTLNSQMFDEELGFLARNPDEFTRFEKTALRATLATLDRMPEAAREAFFTNYRAPYGVTGVFAGATEPTHARTLERVDQQYLVPVKGQCDIQITGIPYISPYNVGSYLNPLLVQVLAQGYFHNLHRGQPLLKQGGTLIITHPLSDRFDAAQHTPYVEFVHRLLAETRDAQELHRRFEREFSRRPEYVERYRNGTCYHPNHPFYMWYWGERGRAHQGRCIVVGSDNDYMHTLLGWERARTMSEAIQMAKQTAPPNPEITCANFAPIMMPHVHA
jgi:lactate racemase-like protein